MYGSHVLFWYIVSYLVPLIQNEDSQARLMILLLRFICAPRIERQDTA
jgi:hypothetical protein